jgi:hypothetical protein
MEMFKCGHGSCKDCYRKKKKKTNFSNPVSVNPVYISTETNECIINFSCPLCRENEQHYSMDFFTENTGKWTTFSEWYNEFEVYIKSGIAKNIVYNSTFGKQLLRLLRENKKKERIRI